MQLSSRTPWRVPAASEPSTYMMLAIAAGIGTIAARRRRTAA